MENLFVHSSNAKLFFPSLPVCAWRWIQIHRRPAIPATLFYFIDNKHTQNKKHHHQTVQLKNRARPTALGETNVAGFFQTATSVPLRPSLRQPIWARLWQPCWYGRPWREPGWPRGYGRGRHGRPRKSAGCHVPADAGDGSPRPRARYDGTSSCSRTAKRWACRAEEDAQILGGYVVEETEHSSVAVWEEREREKNCHQIHLFVRGWFWKLVNGVPVCERKRLLWGLAEVKCCWRCSRF